MVMVPVVDYLRLEPEPHLCAHECTSCGARFFDRRNACAACGGQGFVDAAVATDAVVTAFTIVGFAAPGIEVPFVAAILDCGGTTVQANLRVPPRLSEPHFFTLLGAFVVLLVAWIIALGLRFRRAL